MTASGLATCLAVVLGACAAAPPRPAAPARRLGDAMAETGARFERIGRAGLAGRWELASYDLDELGEIFKEDLAGSSWQGNDQLPAIAKRFESRELAALDAAIHARDRAAFDRAVAQAAATCNECHRAAQKPYIEISATPGSEVPVLDAQHQVATTAP